MNLCIYSSYANSQEDVIRQRQAVYMYGNVRRRLEPAGGYALVSIESEARVDINPICSLHWKFIRKNIDDRTMAKKEACFSIS